MKSPRLGLGLLVLAFALLTAGVGRCGEIAVEEGIVYGRGGGWLGGNRAAHRGDIEQAARRGYVAVTVSYRLMQYDEAKKETATAEPIFPAQVHDVKAAGADHTLLILEGQGHGFRGEKQKVATAAMWGFFAKHLMEE